MTVLLYIFVYLTIGLLLNVAAYLIESWNHNWEQWEEKGAFNDWYRVESFTDYLNECIRAWVVQVLWPVALFILPFYLMIGFFSCTIESYVSKKRASRASNSTNAEES